MLWNERIKKLRQQSGLTLKDIAAKLEVSEATAQRYESNNGIKAIPYEAIQKYAEIFKVKPAYLMGWESEAESKREIPDWVPDNIPGLLKPAAYAVPILGNICCGNGIFANENFDGYFYIDKSIKADFCLRAHGMSMIDAGIQDNDYVLLKKDFDIVDGRIYAVLKKETNEAYLRRLYKQEDQKHIALMPCNADYSPDFQLADDVFIIGECVGVYHEVKY